MGAIGSSDDAGSGGSAGGAAGGTGGAGGAGTSGSGGAGGAGSGGAGGSPPVIGDGGTVDATIVVQSGQTYDGGNKLQINAPSTFRLSNFTASNAGKLIRQNGDTTFEVEVFIDDCDISNMDEAIFRTDSDSSSLTMNNTRYSDIGDAVFIRNEQPDDYMGSGNTEY